MFDSVVVGGGIAGLYAAHKLCRQGLHVALIEKAAELGGRAKTTVFAELEVVTGAGIGRAAKDCRLQALLRLLRVPVKTMPVVHSFATDDACDTAAMFHTVQTAYEAAVEKERTGGKPTFAAFATQVLGPDTYSALVRCSGYSDFEQAAVEDVLYAYGFEDNYTDWTGLAVPWRALIDALRQDLSRRACTIVRGCTVTELRQTTRKHGYHVLTDGAWHALARTVVVATDIGSTRALLPDVPVFAHIHAQPFVRLYAAVSGDTALSLQRVVRGMTIVSGPLQKVLPMSDSVFMVAYADNACAQAVRDLARSKSRVARELERALGFPRLSLRIDALKCIFMDTGTHYNDPDLSTPHKVIQHPKPGVFVVGEAVSRHQGWVEGALESVDDVFTTLLAEFSGGTSIPS